MALSNSEQHLTPCAGRCSTVFGDSVCRGCRRFNHEVIQWNTYTAEQKEAVWLRLDKQLDQILLPLLPQADLAQVEHFLQLKQIRLKHNASRGRKLYSALKLCEKQRNFAAESGLGLQSAEIKPVWQHFEQKVLALAAASYELAYLRAGGIQQHVFALDTDED